ncbi:uncharacterized protein [Rutidosis leptorrhynchoides]|uniref:uncharacterized protein n=1 Tax=Rutidosis leptorrhynchoides TaxID=125765 RepID=UPI003A99A9D5
MKTLLRELPTLTEPTEGETLMMYLANSKESISSILFVDRGQVCLILRLEIGTECNIYYAFPTILVHVQIPMYFVSKAFSGSEVNYPPIEKMVCALVHIDRRMHRYFQAHPIMVLTDQLIRQVLYKLKLFVRLAKWAIELGEHEINYSRRTAVKGQILADYLAETTGEVEILAKSTTIGHYENLVCKMYTDGSCRPECVGAGLVLTSPDGEEHTYAFRFTFTVTNNESEYDALLSGMRIAQQLGI